jgi:hypothetical protein
MASWMASSVGLTLTSGTCQGREGWRCLARLFLLARLSGDSYNYRDRPHFWQQLLACSNTNQALTHARGHSQPRSRLAISLTLSSTSTSKKGRSRKKMPVEAWLPTRRLIAEKERWVAVRMACGCECGCGCEQRGGGWRLVLQVTRVGQA